MMTTLKQLKESITQNLSVMRKLAKGGVLTMSDYEQLLPQGEMKEGMGGWNHKGAIVTLNTKVEPGFKTTDEKQKERFRADIQKRKSSVTKAHAAIDAELHAEFGKRKGE